MKVELEFDIPFLVKCCLMADEAGISFNQMTVKALENFIHDWSLLKEKKIKQSINNSAGLDKI